MISSVATVKFTKSKVIFRCYTKGVSNQVSSNSDFIYVQISVLKWEKRKSGKTFSRLQNGAIRGLQIGACFRDYKLGQEGLQIGAALRISNRGKKIANQGRYFKLGQRGFQSRQSRDYRSGQGLQDSAEHLFSSSELTKVWTTRLISGLYVSSHHF